MERKPRRTIIGWRQVNAPHADRPWLLEQRLPRQPAALQPHIVASEPSAKDRWEGEGGQLLEPAKPRRIKSVY